MAEGDQSVQRAVLMGKNRRTNETEVVPFDPDRGIVWLETMFPYGAILAQQCPADTNEHDFYTVPAGKSAILHSLNVQEIAGGASSYAIVISKGGAATAAAHRIRYGVALAAYGFAEVITGSQGWPLQAGDVVRVQSGGGSTVAFNLFGREI